MPRTHSTFDETYPAGTLQANQIDEIIRRTRLEVKELLEQGLVADCDVDPVVLKAEVSGLKTGKILVYPASSFIGIYTSSFVTQSIVSSSEELNCPIVLPAGVTIRQIEVMVSLGSAASCTISLTKYAFAVGVANSTPWTTTKATTAVEIVNSGAISEVIASDSCYSIRVTGAMTKTVWGARVTYDTTSHLITI